MRSSSDLLGQGLSVDSPDLTYGQTPLMYTCKNGRLSTVKTLLDLGADINYQSTRESTALIEALKAGQLEIAQFLVTYSELDINARSQILDCTIFMLGVWYSYHDLVRLILSRPDIMLNAQDANGDTALAIAGRKNDCELAKIILSHQEANINLPNKYGLHPLYIAAELGDAEIVELLLENGADTTIAIQQYFKRCSNTRSISEVLTS